MADERIEERQAAPAAAQPPGKGSRIVNTLLTVAVVLAVVGVAVQLFRLTRVQAAGRVRSAGGALGSWVLDVDDCHTRRDIGVETRAAVLGSEQKPGFALRIVRRHDMLGRDRMVVTMGPDGTNDAGRRAARSDFRRAGWRVDVVVPNAAGPVELRPEECPRFEFDVDLRLKDDVEGTLSLDCRLPDGGSVTVDVVFEHCV
jgi:hypothetical protein